MKEQGTFNSRLKRTSSVKFSSEAQDILRSPTHTISINFQNSKAEAMKKKVNIDEESQIINHIPPRKVNTQKNMKIGASKRSRKNVVLMGMERPSKQTAEESHHELVRHQKKTLPRQIKNVVEMTELIKLFFEKLSVNSTLREPVYFDPLEDEKLPEDNYICSIEKIAVPRIIDNSITISKIVFSMVYLFAFPLSLLFHQVNDSSAMIVLKTFGIVFCLLDILQILQVPSQGMSSYENVQQIRTKIRRQRNNLLLQLLICLTIVVSLILTHYQLQLKAFFFAFKVINVKDYQKELVKLQGQFFTATHYEKYWDIIKVLAMNLFVCHLLACVLISITFFDFNQTWMTQASITSAPWFEKYIWSYYFGTTIILTIGFGDIHAANHIQAFFIITISFFAVAFFGYNINYIGNRINNIREQQVQKNEKLKVFGTLAKKAKVPEDIRTQIKNYIIQESQIKKVSNYPQEKKLLQELPCTLRSSFLQEANKHLFNHLLKMVQLSKKTIQVLSENIETKICHPDQLIKKARTAPNMIILQSGEVGYSARVKGCSKLNNNILQRITNSLQNQSKLICIDILSLRPTNYDIKSLSYSVIYYLDKQTFEKSIANNQQDFEVYREMLDKCRFKMNQFGLVLCKYCNKTHTAFECPKLHFVPFRNTIPLQYYRKRPLQKQERRKFLRTKRPINLEIIHQMKQNLSGSIALSQEEVQQQNAKVILKDIIHRSISDLNRCPTKKCSTRQSQLRAFQVMNQLREELQSLKREQTQKKIFQFDLWYNSDCDEAHNFAFYFPSGNPKKLAQRKSYKNQHVVVFKSQKKILCRSFQNGLLSTN